MLVKLQDKSYFNFDYVVKLYIISSNDRYPFIRANMIDGKYVDLAELKTLQEAETELKRLVKETNKDRLVIGRT